MLISLRFSHKTQVCFATFSLMEIPGQAGNDRMIIAMLSFVEVVAELHDGAGSCFAENFAVGETFQNGVI